MSYHARIHVEGVFEEKSEDDFGNYYEKYDKVQPSLFANDHVTQNSRGSGFVCVSDPTDKPLEDSHVEAKRASLGTDGQQFHQYHHQQFPNQEKTSRLNESGCNGNDDDNDDDHKDKDKGNGTASDYSFTTKKIFVGGLPSTLTEQEFKNYFDRFGKIVDVVVMQDSLTNRPRGFGFVTFDSDDSVDKAMEEIFHYLKGKRVEVKRAVPKQRIVGTTANNGYIRKGGFKGSFINSNEPSNYFPYHLGYVIIPSYVTLCGYNNPGGVGGYSYGTGFYGNYHSTGINGPSFGDAPVVFGSPLMGNSILLSPCNNAFRYPGHGVGGFSHTNMTVASNDDGEYIEVFDGNEPLPSDSLSSLEGITESGSDPSSKEGCGN